MVMAQKSSRSFKKSHVRYNSKIWFGKEQDLEEYPSVQMHASKVNKTLQDVSFPSPHWKNRVLFSSQHQFQQSRMSMLQKKIIHDKWLMCHQWFTWVTYCRPEKLQIHLHTSLDFRVPQVLVVFFVRTKKKKKGPCKVPVMKKSHLGQGGMSIYSSNFGKLQLIRLHEKNPSQIWEGFPVASEVIELEVSPLNGPWCLSRHPGDIHDSHPNWYIENKGVITLT